jgi:glycosyltransferase involved in cell wall biosynthesis
VFLLPSIIEGLPAVILESFCYKIPVIAYHVGGIGELVRNGQTGFLIKKGDEKEFANATLKALQGGDEISRYVENAHHLVLQNYTLKKVTDRFEIIYAKLSEGKE